MAHPPSHLGAADLSDAIHPVSRRELLDSLFTVVVMFTPDGVLAEANQAAFDAVGLRPEQAIGKRFDQLYSLSHRPGVIAQIAEMIRRSARGEIVRAEVEVRLAGGRLATLDCTSSPLRDGAGNIVRVVGTGVDITARKNADAARHVLTRELRLFSTCNQVLSRTTDEAELLNSVCTILVETGEYRFAWIGCAESDPRGSLRPVASAGIDASYLNQLDISWADNAQGQGPAARAIRERTVQVCSESNEDPHFARWRAETFAGGFVASVALPMDFGDVRAALNIYSQRMNAFQSAEIEVLRELAMDIERTVRTLRATDARRRAEDQLLLFRKLLEGANDLIYLVDAQTHHVLDFNDAVLRHLGYSRDELVQKPLSDFLLLTVQESWEERLLAADAAEPFLVEGQHRQKNGESVPVEVSVSRATHNGRSYLIIVTRDVSERKRQQAQIARLVRVTRMQAGINAAVLHVHDRDELLKEACRLATEVGGYERAIVSIVDKDGRRAWPRFRAGRGEDFPDWILEIADGTEPDTSLSARALRTGEVMVSNDLTQPEPPVARRERLVELGYRSLVALPLVVDGHRLGVLTMSSKDENLVREEELVLLQDMAASLSFALRAQRYATEVQLRAYFDPVTGLANRALFCRRVDEFLARSSGPGVNPAIAAFHVHQLSSINDIYGRHFGDLLLQQVAERVKRRVEDEERIGSLGAGTFVLLEPGCITSRENFASLIEATVFNEPFSIVGRSIRVSCRTGVARYPVHGSSGDTLVRNAEAALAHARQIGEQYLHYAAEIHDELAERLALENRLRSAIDEQQFQLYYQPQINTRTGRIESLEGLLRWNDPEQGIVAPSGFLSVLEDSGMIVAVGRWVLRRAVQDCRRWADLHLGPVRVAVNVSALQIRRRTFVQDILDLVRTYLSGQAGYGVDLEITETTLLQDIEGASRKLQELRAAGVRIALDDFGTGYSSLGLLPRLPVDVIKMDRTFVQGLPADPASATLADSIVRLASTLGLVTVAEGVETPAQMRMLREMNCDQTQGYLHSQPLPAAEIEKLLSACRH